MYQEVVEQVKKIASASCKEIHVALPARIDSVLPDGRINAKPYGTMVVGEKRLEYPVIPAVPVAMYCNVEVSIGLPVISGMDCILLFCDNELEAWKAKQAASVSLVHDLRNAIAIPGISLHNPAMLQANSSSSVIVKNGNTEFEITKTGVQVRGNLHVDGKITSSSQICDRPE